MNRPPAWTPPPATGCVPGLSYRDESGCTILLASHNMAEVERLCSHVLMLKQGRIVDRGSPQDLLDRYGREDMEEVFLDIARNRGHAA